MLGPHCKTILHCRLGFLPLVPRKHRAGVLPHHRSNQAGYDGVEDSDHS